MAQLYFYYSAMNAGKSTSLLQSAYNYEERGMNTVLFTVAFDNRFEQGEITSRIGLNRKAELFDTQTNLYDVLKAMQGERQIDCVLIDEAQFLKKEQVQQLTSVVDDLRIPVLCYGLRSDFLGEPFEGSQYLLIWADKLSEIKAVCHCGRKATMVLKLDSQSRPVRAGAQVEIGGNERYTSVCRKHFFHPDLEALAATR